MASPAAKITITSGLNPRVPEMRVPKGANVVIVPNGTGSGSPDGLPVVGAVVGADDTERG